MKRLIFVASLLLSTIVHGQKIPQKSPYQFTSLKIQEVEVRKDTVSISTAEGLTTDEVFDFVNANQGRLEGIGQVEVINKKGKLRDYYAVNIRTRKTPEVPKLPFQGSFYIGYNTNQYKFRFNYAKSFGISAIVAADFTRPEDSTTLRISPAFTSDFIPFLLPNVRGSIDIGPMFGSQIRFGTIMVRTTVERDISSHWSFGFNYMLVASRKRLSEWGAGISYHF
ncbi:hypothetical protein N9N00_05445 [Schleiferiaceae bacterium]|jgi:hypothetical protein|nr:hypothetical protein [Schleiferiaceae bacterium]